jgi:hypothetical protein
MLNTGHECVGNKGGNAMTAKKPRAEDLVAMTLFNGDGRGLHIDFDDLVKRFGKKTANRMLDVLAPDPAPGPKDWIVETWAARGSVGVALAGADPLHAISQLAGLAVAIGYDKPWMDVKPAISGPVLFVSAIDNVAFVNLALTARRNAMGAQARQMRLAVLGVESLAVFDGEPHLTTNWHDLLDQVDMLKPALVIIDGRNGVLAGDTGDVFRWFGTLAHALAKLHDCAVLLLVDGAGEEDMDRWAGCSGFRFVFSGPVDGEGMRVALATAVARGELSSMPR